MLVNQLLTQSNIPKHASQMDRLSIKPISSLSQGSKTNPTTMVTYSHGTKKSKDYKNYNLKSQLES